MERKPPIKPSELSHLSRPEAIYYPARAPMLNNSQTTITAENNLNEKAAAAV
jgi:hypothetical protein